MNTETKSGRRAGIEPQIMPIHISSEVHRTSCARFHDLSGSAEKRLVRSTVLTMAQIQVLKRVRMSSARVEEKQ